MINLHVHTNRCGHADGVPSQYAAAATAAGVTILGFADHLPLPDGFSRDYAMPVGQLADYVADVRALQDDEGPHGPRVLLGIEADWLPEHRAHVEKLVASYPFDVVLGSVHFLDGWAFDDPRLIAHYADMDIDALWERYFEVLAEAARGGPFDVIAHPDLIKKFGFMPHRDPTAMYESAAAALADAGVAVEVNTAGLRKPCAELYPTAAFLAACRRAGVRATVGTDAHAPGEVGLGLSDAYAALAEAGYRSVTYFVDREPQEVELR